MTNASASVPNAAISDDLWHVVWKLLRLRILIFVSGFRRAKLRSKIMMILAVVLILIFLGFIFFLSWTILRFFRSPELPSLLGDINPVLESVPALIVSGTFIGVLLTSFGVLLQALYLAGDMDFLLSAPVPIRAVFLAKLLQAILPNFGLVCLFALPVLYGLGISSGYSYPFYPLVLMVLSALALAAAGLASLFVMLVVRIFPARRVAEVLGFIGAISSFICSQSGQLARWGEAGPEQAQQALKMVTRLNTPWSPLAWAGRGLVSIGKSEWIAGAVLTTLTLVVCGLVFSVALVTAERLYYSGWASMQNVPRKRKSNRRSNGSATWLPTASPFQIWKPSAIRAIIQKDFLVLQRDMRNMSQLVMPLILGIIYFIMLFRSGNHLSVGRGVAPPLVLELIRNASAYASVGLSLFVGWMLLGRLAGMGFAQEGKSYWLIKTAPVSSTRQIVAKFLVAILPTLGLCFSFLLLTWLIQRTDFVTLLFALPAVGLCIAGNTGIYLSFGIAGANMNWDDPRHMQKGIASCLGTLINMIYLPISLLLFFGPPIAVTLFDVPEIVGQIAGLLLGGVFCLACAIIPLILVHRRVARLGEI
jgi:ABC-2 type transport system permease protein